MVLLGKDRLTFGIVMLVMGIMAIEVQAGSLDRSQDEIARVNGVSITRREFQVEYRTAVDRHAQEGNPIDEAHIAPIRQAVIQRMVDDELLFQESQRLGLVVTAEEINREVSAARARFKDAAAFKQELARQHMDETHYRVKLYRQRAIQRVIEQQVMPVVRISDDDLHRFYEANRKRYHIPEKIRLRHILIRAADEGDTVKKNAARRKIEMIRDRLIRGEDFERLAREYSEEPRREQGGDLGYVQRGKMLPQLETVAFGLAVGETSPILTTVHGFHLLHVTDRKPEREVSFKEARLDIQNNLLQVRRELALKKYLEELRKKADIHTAY